MKKNQIEPQINGVYSRNDLPKIKDGALVTNLDEYRSIATSGVAIYDKNDATANFDRFGVEQIPKEIKKFIGIKNIGTNIYRIQSCDSIIF